MINVGLIVNPIAGMGGSVGLKGTDGNMYEKALELGAEPVATERIRQVLSLITRKDLNFLAAPGKMGEALLKSFDFSYDVIGSCGEPTTSEDTKSIASQMIRAGADILVFAGGDGTARDIMDAVGMEIPVIAVPSGVKMFSSVFTFSAHAAAEMINTFTDKFIEKEILDIDEEAFRDNRLVAKYYGTVRVPDVQRLLQGKKAASNVQTDAEEKKREVAREIIDSMDEDTLYILGPGTTVKAITDALGLEKTLLGVDAVCGRETIGKDLNESGLLALLDSHEKAVLVVTPIGGNGFIFGRGSKQFSPQVLKRVGRDYILVVGTLDKISGLESLRVDTGDYEVDQLLAGPIEIMIGEGETMVMGVRY